MKIGLLDASELHFYQNQVYMGSDLCFVEIPTQYKLVMPIRQFKAMWKSSEIGRRLQVCPC